MPAASGDVAPVADSCPEEDGPPGVLFGRPIVYDTPTAIDTPYGPFLEIIASGSVRDAMNDPRITAVRDHDPGRLLGRVQSGTLMLHDTLGGLDCAVALPDTDLGEETATLVERGDLSGMSFAASGLTDEWLQPTAPDGMPTRIIRKIARLYDVAIVTWPAYPSTSVSLKRPPVTGRSALADAMREFSFEQYETDRRGLPGGTSPADRLRDLRWSQLSGKPASPSQTKRGARYKQLPEIARWVHTNRRLVRLGRS